MKTPGCRGNQTSLTCLEVLGRYSISCGVIESHLYPRTQCQPLSLMALTRKSIAVNFTGDGCSVLRPDGSLLAIGARHESLYSLCLSGFNDGFRRRVRENCLLAARRRRRSWGLGPAHQAHEAVWLDSACSAGDLGAAAALGDDERRAGRRRRKSGAAALQRLQVVRAACARPAGRRGSTKRPW